MKSKLLSQSEKLASDIASLCDVLHVDRDLKDQIRRSSRSVYANIHEANYPQSLSDMLSKLKISLKECYETEGWLKHLLDISAITVESFKTYRNSCGRIRRMLIASCKTIESKLPT